MRLHARVRSNFTRATILVLVFFVDVGFVPGPFSHWARGKVTSIDPATSTLHIQEASEQALTLHWNAETRMWLEPIHGKDSGIALDPEELAVGSEVKVMFKKVSAQKKLLKVIRVAPLRDSRAKRK